MLEYPLVIHLPALHPIKMLSLPESKQLPLFLPRATLYKPVTTPVPNDLQPIAIFSHPVDKLVPEVFPSKTLYKQAFHKL